MSISKGLAICLLVLGLLIGGLVASVAFPSTVTVEKQVNVSVPSVYNDSAIRADINAIKDNVLADDNFKANVTALANAEWSDRSNKVIFNGLVDLGIAIDEKTDISSIVIKDTEVTDADRDNQDATVVQELKVYYEDLTGEKVKAYVTVTSTIVDGEVDDQVVSLNN